MKRFSAMVVVLGMVAILAGLALAAETEKTPDATLTLSEGQVAVGIGWSWGKGVLTLEGKNYPFKIEGLSVLDVGITKAEGGGQGQKPEEARGLQWDVRVGRRAKPLWASEPAPRR